MGRPRRDQSDARVIADWIKEGRGKGRNGGYCPWIVMQDFPSKGESRRTSSHITGNRNVHLFSNYETYCFFIFEWSASLIDIREQYPLLPLQRTLEIAHDLNVDHPVNPDTGMPVVMTTDFVLNVIVDGKEKEVARDFKLGKHLHSPKTIAKFEIVRRFHEEAGRDWGIISELDLSLDLGRNLELLRDRRSFEGFDGVSTETVQNVREVLLPLIWRGDASLSANAIICDKQLGIRLGTSLTVAFHLIYNREWIVDLTRKLDQGKPLILIAPQPMESKNVFIQLPVTMA